ncbi:hypothetical protein [Prescottella sp. R16]|uniref:hypothetical protein n=1 Tax=Prescottella sp. R16 TaxID=3064529 RepID=UPI00272ED397|nr:hypothetical protein [Prescottella sp. R16]
MTTPLSPEPEQPRRSRHLTWKATRPALAASAVALSVFGLSQASPTSAAFQDTAQATSGALTVAGNVLPEVAKVDCTTIGVGTGSQDAQLRWNHLGPAYKYRVDVYKEGSSTPYTGWDKDPGVGFATGGQILSAVTSDDTQYGGTQDYIAQVHTVNRYTNEKSEGWRGYRARRGGATWNVWCQSAVTGNVLAAGSDSNLLRSADQPSAVTPENVTPSSPDPVPTTAKTTTSAETTTSTTTTPSSTTTTAPSTTTTTAPSTTTTTAPSTTTTTAPSTTLSETPLGTAQKSPSGYTAMLVQSPDSETAIAIVDASGDELQRISVSASATYEWDESSDTLWITDGGKRYRVAGSSWTKTAVDTPSGEAASDDTTPADTTPDGTAPTADSALTE